MDKSIDGKEYGNLCGEEKRRLVQAFARCCQKRSLSCEPKGIE